MPADWPTTTIAEVAADEPYSTQIGPFGNKIRARIYTELGEPVLRGTNVNTAERFYDQDFVFVSEDYVEKELSKFICRSGDVILCHKGTLGKIGLIPATTRFPRYVMGNSMMKVRCDPEKMEPLFLYYWLCSPAAQHYLYSRVSQVGVPQIQRPLSTLREARLPCPPINEQRSIAAVLGTLDDKIEVNRRMNGTLEELARAIYKSWFVDFDPVHAKADGRQPAFMDAETAALFPDGFDDSELGPIPAGWRVARFDSVAKQRRETVKPDAMDETMPYIGLQDMPRGSVALDCWGHAGVVDSAKSRFDQGDVLFGKLRPYFHKVGAPVVDGVASTDIIVITPTKPELRPFVLAWASSNEMVAHATAVSSGTRMPRAKWKDLAEYAIALPPEEPLRAYGQVVGPMLERIAANIHESRTLAELRDLLLPELLSGEIRVGEAEERVQSSTKSSPPKQMELDLR